MQKIILLLLVISSSMHAMEKFSFSNVVSYACSFIFTDQKLNDQTFIESGCIQVLCANKSKFEEQLQIKEWDTEYMGYVLHELFSTEIVSGNPVQFLKYCYWQSVHKKHLPIRIEQQFDYPPDLFHKCKNVRVNGYSALGAAMIAQGVSDQDKANFILELKNRGYVLTEKDKELMVLEFYDSISVKDKEVMICMLCDQDISNFSELPHDVRRYSVQLMIDGFKDKHVSIMDMGMRDPELEPEYQKYIKLILEYNNIDMLSHEKDAL